MKVFRVISLIVVLSVLCGQLAACSIVRPNDPADTQTNEFVDMDVVVIDRPHTLAATIAVDSAMFYDFPTADLSGEVMAQLSMGMEIQVTQAYAMEGIIWLHCVEPLENVWVPLNQVEFQGAQQRGSLPAEVLSGDMVDLVSVAWVEDALWGLTAQGGWVAMENLTLES